MTIIYCESNSPDTLVVETKTDGRRVVIRLEKESIAATLGTGSPTFRALSDAVASRIDEITSNHAYPSNKGKEGGVVSH